ncbi:preprotein translocase subunit YajC [Clostridium aminobutyricum]|uniref:Preprotein translocase subunit YajC n=1 Tax=Clostridium aminobutyricum TaxID=33953 RepID=A0A939D6I0_CLOAM|nr:preprotein translocase subunit YajC [Clostridium aminobutyricum]MBN7772434.1 preprotein translocase subunit YajC [Clostridium aminobutyricum]
MSNSTLIQLAPLAFLIFIMYFLLIRPQKKKEKAVNEMRNNVKVGDDVITIGGLCGKIVKVKDETIVIQVGAEKLKFEMMKWAISKVVSSNESRVSSKKARPDELSEDEDTSKKALPKRMKRLGSEEADSEEAVEPIEDVLSENTEEK